MVLDNSIDLNKECPRIAAERRQMLIKFEDERKSGQRNVRSYALQAFASECSPWVAIIALHLAADEQKIARDAWLLDQLSATAAYEGLAARPRCAVETRLIEKSLSSIHFSLAEVEFRMGRLSESARHLNLASRNISSLSTSEYRQKIETAIQEFERLLNHALSR